METLEPIVKNITASLGGIAEIIAAVIIAHATITALIRYLNLFIRKSEMDQLEIRLNLGKALALALEFLLAADIIRTAVAPTWNDIGQLAAIATLRTLLNYFLERELTHEPEVGSRKPEAFTSDFGPK